MKTYWLQTKAQRVPGQRINDHKPIIETDESLSSSKEFIQDTARVVVYSPITFQDVARRSIACSPVKTLSRGRFKNSCNYFISLCIF